MNEIVKVKVSGVTLGMSHEACGALSDYIATLERAYGATPEGKEVVADIEARIVELILEKQKADVVVEKPLIDNIIATLGYPEGCEKVKGDFGGFKSQQTPSQEAQNQGCLHTLGRIVVFCLKVLAVLFLVGWILGGLGLIIGIIVLLTTDAALTGGVAFSGVSPIGFTALLCGSILVFMASVAYLLICLLGHKRVSGRTMLFAGILWLLLTVWAWVGMGTNLSNWESWGYSVEQNAENWAERIEDWAEQFEEGMEMQMEILEYNMDALDDNMDNIL
jgi:hypothetical protein